MTEVARKPPTGSRKPELTHVDAFSDKPFAGNPAAVCLLEAPRDEVWMQHVAAEMNLAETALLCFSFFCAGRRY